MRQFNFKWLFSEFFKPYIISAVLPTDMDDWIGSDPFVPIGAGQNCQEGRKIQ
jgi:hypothetical protein